MVKEILIVDDEPNVLVPIHFLMEQQGYRVMTAERGEDGLLEFMNFNDLTWTAKWRKCARNT